MWGFEVTNIFGEYKYDELSKEGQELMVFNTFYINQQIEGNDSINI